MSYIAHNGPMATTAAQQKVTTGTAIKTLMQLSTPSTRQMRIVEWGYTLDAAPATTGTGNLELIETGAIAATVTAYVASGVQNLDPNGTASLLTLGTANSGYTASAEGSIVATRCFDSKLVSGVSNGADPVTYVRTFMPGYQPIVAVSRFLRVRCTFSAAVNATCFVIWDEI